VPNKIPNRRFKPPRMSNQTGAFPDPVEIIHIVSATIRIPMIPACMNGAFLVIFAVRKPAVAAQRNTKNPATPNSIYPEAAKSPELGSNPNSRVVPPTITK